MVDYVAKVTAANFLRDYLPGADLDATKLRAARKALRVSLKDVRKESGYYDPLVSPLSESTPMA